MADEIVTVAPEAWVDTVMQVRQGRDFDWLSAIDQLGRNNSFTVVARLDAGAGVGIRVQTDVDRDDPRLPSLVPLLPGAAWHERETAEQFGIVFDGGDDRRLLIPTPDQPGTPGTSPLRKDAVLPARAVQPPPADRGAATDARRRQSPPGVPDPQVWGERDPDSDPPTPDEVLRSGGRRRPR